MTVLMAMGLAAEPLVRVKEYPSECHRLRLVFFHNLQHRGSSCVLWPTFSFNSLKLLNGASWVHTSTPATPTTQSVISADASLSLCPIYSPLQHHVAGLLLRAQRTRDIGQLLHGRRSAATVGRNVTSAGWQVTLCDPMWHVSSRSGVATLPTAIHLLLTYKLRSV